MISAAKSKTMTEEMVIKEEQGFLGNSDSERLQCKKIALDF